MRWRFDWFQICRARAFGLESWPSILNRALNICWGHTRLRQESEILSRSSSQHWSQSDLQSYASTTNIATDNDSAHLVHGSDSLSSTETLKWLGSMSDISSSSHATNTSHISASGNYYQSSSSSHFAKDFIH